ncbi:MAG: FG-GAP-like repeat-containing protein [Flavobacteriaceae bacterium]|nr:FG-GAP-like repeat-containing protein [Flavobacteriaceae bacterium]
MLTDAVWTDFDGDKKTDLIVAGEWMAPLFFKNENNTFVKVNMTGEQKLTGLWQQMHLFDIDGDGDEDIVLGNWGNNSKLTASQEFPLKMYYGDVDGNKISETILAIAKKGKYYPLLGLDELSSQFSPMLKKKFTDYGSFAKQDLEGIFDPESLKKANLFEVHELSSGYLENKNGTYLFHPFPEALQLAPVTRFLTFDFDRDGREELLAAGNFFGITPFHGRLDANPGFLIKSNSTVIPAPALGMNLSSKLVRGLQVINIQQKEYVLVTLNNNKPELYLIKKQNK